MPSASSRRIDARDRQILRGLAQRIRQIADDPLNQERRRLWLQHASLRGERPMILAETGGVLDELLPVSILECREDWARGLERGLRNTIFEFEQVGDDKVVEPWINCQWHVQFSDYGVTHKLERPQTDGRLGSYRWEAALRDLDADFDRLRPRTFSVDREATAQWKATVEEVFDGVLGVRVRGGFWWTLGMTWTAATLVGLEGLMLAMVDNPEGLHRLMAFLRDDHLALIDWCEREGLLTLNNENDYIGSGSAGYTTELPQAGWQPGQPARLRDLWMLSESQETVGVSPEMFGEFIFPYQLPIIEKFGTCYYGCCEPVHSRWEHLRKIPNLRRVSVSPWCDQEFMAEACNGTVVFCRKPNPALISKEHFDEAAMREDLRHTLRAARRCHVELVMKDVHTLCRQPARLGRWVQLAREVSAEVWR